jgi:hypothetical protein
MAPTTRELTSYSSPFLYVFLDFMTVLVFVGDPSNMCFDHVVADGLHIAFNE